MQSLGHIFRMTARRGPRLSAIALGFLLSVAVATGMGPIALGTDGGGSIRIPAATLLFARPPNCSIAISRESGHVQATVDHRHIRRCPRVPIASSDDGGGGRSSSYRRFWR